MTSTEAEKCSGYEKDPSRPGLCLKDHEPIESHRCAINCVGCHLKKHPCGGARCDGYACCACGAESGLAIHADWDEGGCRDPQVPGWLTAKYRKAARNYAEQPSSPAMYDTIKAVWEEVLKYDREARNLNVGTQVSEEQGHG